MGAIRQPAFGSLLKQYRLAATLSQQALAERSGLSVRAISDLERGVNRRPQPTTLQRLTTALHLAAADRAALLAARSNGTPAPHGSAPLALLSGRDAPPWHIGPPPLVGRRAELTLLETHLSGAGPPVLLLAGEPGIGKTRLLHEAAGAAAAYGLRVLQGGRQRRAGGQPYAPLLDALRDHLGRQPVARLRTELRDCAWLVRLLPELAAGPIEALPPWTLPPSQERRLMFEAVRRVMANGAGPAGTLLVLDDLQWAGADALDLLTSLLNSSAGAAIRVVGAYRDSELHPQGALTSLLADLAQAGQIVHHRLARLMPDETRELLDMLLEGQEASRVAARERIARRTEGLPLFAVSFARDVQVGTLAPGGEEAVPWDVTQGIRQRVAALPAATQDVLGVAAAVGRVVSCPLLLSVVERPEVEVLAALETACRAQLLLEAGNDCYQFTHDVIREVIEADLATGRRGLLQRRIAEALARTPGEPSVDALAYHYGESDDQDKALLYLAQAGDHARAQYASATAETYYRELIERLDRLTRAPEAARTREKLGAVLHMDGRYAAALEVLEQAASVYQATRDLESLARTTALIGWAHSWNGTPLDGLERLWPLTQRLEATGARHGLAELYAALAPLLFATGRYSDLLVTAERTAGMAREAGDARLLAGAEGARGLALRMMGHVQEARQVLEEVIPLAAAAGDFFALVTALHNVAFIYLMLGEFHRGAAAVERTREITERSGDLGESAFRWSNRGRGAFYRGDWAQAGEDIREGLALRPQVGTTWIFAYVLLETGRLYMAKGERDVAAGHLEECLAMVEPMGDLQARRWAQGLLAERDLLERRPDAARRRLTPLLDRADLEEPDVTALLPLLAWTHLALGDTGQADHVAADAVRRGRAESHRLALTDALRVQSMIMSAQQRWNEAALSLDEGLILARAMPYPYAEARLLHVYGEVKARQGQREPAQQHLAAALTLFQRLGAGADIAVAEQALADLGSSDPVPHAGVARAH